MDENYYRGENDRRESCLDTGVCAMHQIEVERRKPLKYIPELLTFMNRMKGWAFVITIMIVGSYGYTTISKGETKGDIERSKAEIKQDLNKVEKELKTEMKELTVNVNKLTISVTRNEERHKSLLEQLERQNEIMMDLLKKGDNDYEGN